MRRSDVDSIAIRVSCDDDANDRLALRSDVLRAPTIQRAGFDCVAAFARSFYRLDNLPELTRFMRDSTQIDSAAFAEPSLPA